VRSALALPLLFGAAVALGGDAVPEARSVAADELEILSFDSLNARLKTDSTQLNKEK
jgi:hypothetical protein